MSGKGGGRSSGKGKGGGKSNGKGGGKGRRLIEDPRARQRSTIALRPAYNLRYIRPKTAGAAAAQPSCAGFPAPVRL